MANRLRVMILLGLFYICVILPAAHAQHPYNIGSIGMTGSTVPVFSGPLVFSGRSCVTISNGINNFNVSKKGPFKSDCTEDPPAKAPTSAGMVVGVTSETVSAGIYTAYPNPVTSGVIIKARSASAKDVSTVLLELVAMDGRVLSRQSTTIPKLIGGLLLDASSLTRGSYLIKIHTKQQPSSILKIIKAN